MIEKYLNNRFLILYLIPFTIGIFSVFSFQPFNLTFLNFFILPIFFYLTVFIKKKSKNTYRKKPYKKNLFIFGTTFGFGFFLGSIHWITNSLSFDENFKFLIPLGFILIPLFLSLFFSILTVLVGPFLKLGFNSIILFSAGLALSDYLRAKILTGFPWNLWSYSFSWVIEYLQILEFVGLFAFNLISITIFMAPSILFLQIKKINKIFSLFLIILIFFTIYIYGDYSINQNKKKLENIENKYNIKVISPNFKIEYDLSIDQIEKRLQYLIRYSNPEKNLKTLFIWPEGVFSGYNFSQIKILKEIFKKHFSKNHLILFGVNRFDPYQIGTYNSLIIVNHQMEILEEYRKQKLVPFGEFLPFEKFLNNFGIKKITEGYGSFLKGKKQNNIKINNMNILPLICYEIIFTELIQKSEVSTNLLVNISEDGWFGRSIGPHQHFTKSIFRAIEQNSFLIRSANKGISAIINNKGEIVKKLDLNETGNIELTVTVIENKNKNKNDLIFFSLLITYILIFIFNKKNNEKK